MPLGALQVWGTFQLPLVWLFVAQELQYYCQRFFFLFSFMLLPKFAIAELSILDNKQAFCSNLHLF